jgi:mannose/fructose-specific phosphotransferase system component IIA
VLDFLVAAGALRRKELFVVSGTNSSMIFDLYSETLERSLFEAELTALRQLKAIVITNDMLEGW